MDFRYFSKFQTKKRQRSSLRDKGDEGFSAVNERCKLKKSEELLQVHAEETAFGDKKYDYCRLKLMAQKTLQAENRRFSFQSAKSPRGQTCNESSEQKESKTKRQRQCQNSSVRGDCIRWITKGQCSFGEACAFKHDPNKNGKGNGTTSFTFSDGFTTPKLER